MRHGGHAEGGGRSGRRWSGILDGAGGEIKPLALAVAQGREANPMQDHVFIAIEVESDRGGRAVEEIKPTLPTHALQRKATDAMTGQAR